MRSRLSKLLSVCLAALMALSIVTVIPNETQASSSYTLSGVCHVQDYGDIQAKWDANTGILTLGTRGQSKRVEAMTINFTNNTGYSGTIQYRVHVQNIGWQEYRNAGTEAGTRGKALRLEGLEMRLTGELANHYIIQYRVHIQDYGDEQGWVNSGAMAGTAGESKRLEEVQVRLVPIDGGSTSVKYRVHVQDYGWESKWVSNGNVSGTTGKAKRLEGIEIHLDGCQYAGSITYHTHIQNIGWESTWATAGEMSGTQGMSYRLEGIEIALTGEIANHYDVYYRVHAQDFGWLGWAKNGQMSGTSGTARRLEAIQIVLVAKSSITPGNIAGITSTTTQPCVVGSTPTTWSTGTAPTPPAPTTAVTTVAPVTTPVSSSTPAANTPGTTTPGTTTPGTSTPAASSTAPTVPPTPSSVDNPNFYKAKFDLGGNGTAPGYIGVSASQKYDKNAGYGFAMPDHAHNVQALGTGALSDAVAFDYGNAHFKVDLEPAVYRITVTTGNCESPTINAEGVNQIFFMTGNNAVDSFTIPVTDGQLNIYASHGVGNEFSISAIEIEQVSEGTATKPTIWLCGDSTVKTYYNVPEDSRRGWGEYLGNYVDTDTYDIRNISISGLRSSTMLTSAFPTFEAYGKSGDILVLAVGINDYSDEYNRVTQAGLDTSHIDPTSYVQNVTEMVRRAKALGVTVYLVKQHGDYDDCNIYPLLDEKWFSEEIDQIAASENVGVIDMFHPWLQFCLEKSSLYSKDYYEIVEYEPGEFGVSIHPNAKGANEMAKIVASALFPVATTTVNPYPNPGISTSVTYETELSDDIITNPHKGYVMEVHNLNMLVPGGHALGIDGSSDNHAWDVISTCTSVLRWEDLNPAKGVYDFTTLEQAIAASWAAGYTYAIRIMPYSTGNGTDANYGVSHDFVPQWVYDAGAKRDLATYKYGDQNVEIYIPDWSDPVYNQAYKDFITALAAEYDGDPRVEYIENRAYGNFGEWHTSEFLGNDMPSAELQMAMLDHFAACFKNTTVSVFRDATLVGDYAISLGFARRNDGYILAKNTEWEMVPAYRANVMTMADNHNTYKNMLNPTSPSYLKWTPEHYRESIEIGHLTFMAIDQDSGCGLQIYQEHTELINDISRELGYDFTVTYAARDNNTLVVTIENIGLAPCFFDINLAAEITDANGNRISTIDTYLIEEGTFHDGDERTYVFEYNGTLRSDMNICLAMYEADNTLVSGLDPTVRFDNKNTLPNNRLLLVAK